MSKELSLFDAQLPAHLQDDSDGGATDSLVVNGPKFPRLSIRGGKFRLRKDGDEKVLKLDELKVVIVAATPLGKLPSKIFYKSTYSPGDDMQPDCVSSDGVRPDAGVEHPQSATTCAVCPKNAWGSGTDAAGNPSKGKACKDSKALYLVAPGKNGLHDEVIQLRVPTMSLRSMSQYASQLGQRKIAIHKAYTVLSFVEDATHPELRFGFGGFLDEGEYEQVREIMAGPEITEVLSGEVPIVEDEGRTLVAPGEVEEIAAIEDVEEAPVKKVAKKKAAAPKKKRTLSEAKKKATSMFDEEDEDEVVEEVAEVVAEEEEVDDFDSELESLLDDLE